MTTARIDEIGYWSELKLVIVKKYASAYSTILTNQKIEEKRRGPSHAYIEAFAGAGVHLPKATREMVPGSPLNALAVRPPFDEFHLIDMDATRVEGLREMIGDRRDVHLHEGDCNEILLRRVLPQLQWRHFRRVLCLLETCGLHLDWEVVRTAGQMKTFDLFLNLPMAGTNCPVLWNTADEVDPAQRARMNAFWGDESWREVVQSAQENLSGHDEKVSGNDPVLSAYRKRLRDTAGFKHVSEALPIRNSANRVVSYLVLASQKNLAAKTLSDLFLEYRDRPGS